MYGRIFEGFWDSSLCQKESYATRLAFAFMFTVMDEDGYVHCPNAQVLARRANITVEEAGEAIRALSSPDPDSSNPANEGRRIEVVAGGFLVLNAQYYRGIKNREMQREKNRERVAKWRKTKKCNAVSVTSNASVISCNTPSEYEYELHKGGVGGKENGKARGTLDEVKAVCLLLHLTEQAAVYFFNKCEGNGWTNGGKPIKDWKATVRAWHAAGYFPEQKSNHKTQGGHGFDRL